MENEKAGPEEPASSPEMHRVRGALILALSSMVLTRQVGEPELLPADHPKRALKVTYLPSLRNGDNATVTAARNRNSNDGFRLTEESHE
jgi:hypothetical protein